MRIHLFINLNLGIFIYQKMLVIKTKLQFKYFLERLLSLMSYRPWHGGTLKL